MSDLELPKSLYIGWDVGGWNCDKNPVSRDALVILDANLAVVGEAWRGNLRKTINDSPDAQAFIQNIFALCEVGTPPAGSHVTLAIDAPLGFSDSFVKLARGQQYEESIGLSETNPYLYRHTEQFLFKRGLKPLSPIKDMIGSQATKAMHFVAKFAPKLERCGVWQGGRLLTAIEAYPSGCRKSKRIEELGKQVRNPPGDQGDKTDALICALVAYLFTHEPDRLIRPGEDVPSCEGWIWIPTDALRRAD